MIVGQLRGDHSEGTRFCCAGGACKNRERSGIFELTVLIREQRLSFEEVLPAFAWGASRIETVYALVADRGFFR